MGVDEVAWKNNINAHFIVFSIHEYKTIIRMIASFTHVVAKCSVKAISLMVQIHFCYEFLDAYQNVYDVTNRSTTFKY